MPCIGVISGHLKKPKRWFFGKYTKEVILNEKNPFCLDVVRVPFSEDELLKMPRQRLRRILVKARKHLEDSECESVVMSDAFEGCCEQEQNKIAHAKRQMFMSTAHLCVRRISALYGINLMEAKVCIRDGKTERISENLMKQLRFDTKTFILCTDDLERGRQICDDFFDSTGMSVLLTREFKDSRADVVIDVDNCQVRFGRIVTVDGVMPDFELENLPVDALAIAACLKNFDITKRNLSYFSGKKKLTL